MQTRAATGPHWLAWRIMAVCFATVLVAGSVGVAVAANPSISSITPDAGPVTGGNTVVVAGSNLTGVTEVDFGALPVTSFISKTGGSLSLTVPDGSSLLAGKDQVTVDVTFVFSGGSRVKSNFYTYQAAPEADSVDPAAGPVAGGNTVTINGHHLKAATEVDFGTVAVTSFTSAQAQSITLVAPAGTAPGALDVKVVSPGGISTITSGYTYFAVPTVNSVTPSFGPVTGKNVVTISGTNLAGTSEVDFGGVAGTNVSVAGDGSSLTIKVPASATAGAVDVKLTTPGGSATLVGGYTYWFVPTVTGVSPSAGPVAGGNSVTISGTNLTGATEVDFDTLVVTSGIVPAGDGNSLTVTVPDGTSLVTSDNQAVRVKVFTPGGSDSLANGYVYRQIPELDGVTPNSGALAGGNTVTIEGRHLGSVTEVDFGTAAVTSFTTTSPKAITLVVPAGTSSGPVDVKVITPGGTDTITGGYSYDAAPVGTVVIHQVSLGGDGTFTFTSATSALRLAITTSGGSGQSAPISLSSGTYSVAVATPAGDALLSVSCDDSDSTGDAVAGTASIVLADAETVSCTFTTRVGVDTSTEALIGDFFDAQGHLLLGNIPDLQRRIDRLENVAPAPDIDPGTALHYLASGSLPSSVSASLSAIDAATGRPQSALDVWFSQTWGRFDGDGLGGNYGIAAVGADYLVSRNLLLGGFVQADIEPEADNGAGGSIGARGWLAGPYATIRLNDSLFLDVLAAAGMSQNTVSPDGTYTDSFNSVRWLASATLTGDWQADDWTFSPEARLSVFSATSEAYIDGLGVDIPSVTGTLGQLALGPHVSHRMDLGGLSIVATAGLDGVLDVSLADGAATVNSAYGRAKVGLDVTNATGLAVNLSAAYDGIGAAPVHGLSGQATLSVPIH